MSASAGLAALGSSSTIAQMRSPKRLSGAPPTLASRTSEWVLSEPSGLTWPCRRGLTSARTLATKEMLVAALADFEGAMLFVSHDRHFLAVLSNRVLELTPEGGQQYGGGYTEYVTRTGQEAPGLHPGG